MPSSVSGDSRPASPNPLSPDLHGGLPGRPPSRVAQNDGVPVERNISGMGASSSGSTHGELAGDIAAKRFKSDEIHAPMHNRRMNGIAEVLNFKRAKNGPVVTAVILSKKDDEKAKLVVSHNIQSKDFESAVIKKTDLIHEVLKGTKSAKAVAETFMAKQERSSVKRGESSVFWVGWDGKYGEKEKGEKRIAKQLRKIRSVYRNHGNPPSIEMEELGQRLREAFPEQGEPRVEIHTDPVECNVAQEVLEALSDKLKSDWERHWSEDKWAAKRKKEGWHGKDVPNDMERALSWSLKKYAEGKGRLHAEARLMHFFREDSENLLAIGVSKRPCFTCEGFAESNSMDSLLIKGHRAIFPYTIDPATSNVSFRIFSSDEDNLVDFEVDSGLNIKESKSPRNKKAGDERVDARQYAESSDSEEEISDSEDI